MSTEQTKNKVGRPRKDIKADKKKYGFIQLELEPYTELKTFCDANGTRSDRPDGGLYVNETDITSTLTSAGIGTNVAQPVIVHGTQDPCTSDIAFAQGTNNGGENVLVQPMAVRKLLPKECERLQGFPDNYTDIQHKGKATPDGPRYKALGNSMAVPVMAWIGKRIKMVENL